MSEKLQSCPAWNTSAMHTFKSSRILQGDVIKNSLEYTSILHKYQERKDSEKVDVKCVQRDILYSSGSFWVKWCFAWPALWPVSLEAN